MCHYQSDQLHSGLSRPSCSAAITGEITTTHSRGRVAPFSLWPSPCESLKEYYLLQRERGDASRRAHSRVYLPCLQMKGTGAYATAPIAPAPIEPTLSVSGIMKMSRRFEAVSPRGKRASGQRRRSACTQDNLVSDCRKSVITN